MCRKGDQRRVSVFKNKTKADIKKKENLTCFTFSEEAKLVLQDMFTRYPPDDCEMGEEMVGKLGGNTDKIRRKKDDIFSRPLMSKAEIEKKVESLASAVENVPKLKQVLRYYNKLWRFLIMYSAVKVGLCQTNSYFFVIE